MATPSPKKRMTSNMDEDDLLLEDAITPAKKARNEGDLFEEEELDEDALLGLSDVDDHYEGNNAHPELDQDGGYEVFPSAVLALEDNGGQDDIGGGQEYHEEEYQEEQSYEVETGTSDESALYEDVLDINITDDSLILELEEDSSSSSAPGPQMDGTFVRPTAPPPKNSTPKTTPTRTTKPAVAAVQPQPAKPVVKQEIKAPDSESADENQDDEDEEKQTRGDRFKSERKEMVSLKSSRHRDIPDTLELSEEAKKELAEYERQEQEEKQKRMQRRQRGRGGRGNRGGGPRGGRGNGPRGRCGMGMMNNNRMGGQMRPPFGHPRFGDPRFRGRPPLFRQQGPPFQMRGPLFRQRSPPGRFRQPFPRPMAPVVIPPLISQQPLITLTNADFTEDTIPGEEPFHRGSPRQEHREGRDKEPQNSTISPAPPHVAVSQYHHNQQQPPSQQQQQPGNVPRSEARPGIHVNPHFKGQRPEVVVQISQPQQVVTSGHPIPSLLNPPHLVSSAPHPTQWESDPWGTTDHGQPQASQAWSSQYQHHHNQQDPIYAQSNMGGDRTTIAVPPHQQYFEPQHQHNTMETYHGNQSEPHHQQQHHNSNQNHQPFRGPRHNSPPFQHFGGPRPPNHLKRNPNQRDQQQHHKIRHQGPRHQGPTEAVAPKKPRLAPPPQAIIREAAKHQQETEALHQQEVPVSEAGPGDTTTSEESDPETKILRLQIEEQKKLREAIMRRKEERRQQLASKKQLELKMRVAAKQLAGQSEQGKKQGGMNIQQQHSPQDKQGQQKPVATQPGRGRGSKVAAGQRGRGAQQRRNSGNIQGQQPHAQNPPGNPIPTLGASLNKPPPIHQHPPGRPFHRGGGPHNVPPAGRGHMQHHQGQRGAMASRPPIRGQVRGRGRGQRGHLKRGGQRGALVSGPPIPQLVAGGLVPMVRHPPPLLHAPGQLHIIPQGAPQSILEGKPLTAVQPHHQQPPQQQLSQRGRGQPRGRGSIKDRLGRGRGRGANPKQLRGGSHQGQRGAPSHWGQRGRGGPHGQAPPHPHPGGGGDAQPMLNPQSGVSIEGLALQTKGEEIMKRMQSIGVVQALKMYPQHRKAIGFFFNPIDAITFHQTFNGSVIDFTQVMVKLIQGRPGT